MLFIILFYKHTYKGGLMSKGQKKDSFKPRIQKYSRIKDVMERYNCSRGHINNLVAAGILPPPMTDNGVKEWPNVMLDERDKQRDQKYFRMLKDNGFSIPETLAK
jgi:hypothetical protein